MSQVTLLVCSKTRTEQRFLAPPSEPPGIHGVAMQALGEGQGLSAPGLTCQSITLLPEPQTEAAIPLPPLIPGLHTVNLSCKSR